MTSESKATIINIATFALGAHEATGANPYKTIYQNLMSLIRDLEPPKLNEHDNKG